METLWDQIKAEQTNQGSASFIFLKKFIFFAFGWSFTLTGCTLWPSNIFSIFCPTTHHYYLGVSKKTNKQIKPRKSEKKKTKKTEPKKKTELTD